MSVFQAEADPRVERLEEKIHVFLPLDTNNPWKNEGFRPLKIWVITPKNEGYGFPW